jgi:hypothetical protein
MTQLHGTTTGSSVGSPGDQMSDASGNDSDSDAGDNSKHSTGKGDDVKNDHDVSSEGEKKESGGEVSKI